MRLPVGSWIWLKAMVAPLLVAVKISTGIDTRASLIWPFQYARAAIAFSPAVDRFASDSIAGGHGGSPARRGLSQRIYHAGREDGHGEAERDGRRELRQAEQV